MNLFDTVAARPPKSRLASSASGAQRPRIRPAPPAPPDPGDGRTPAERPGGVPRRVGLATVASPYDAFIEHLLAEAGLSTRVYDTTIGEADAMFWNAMVPSYGGQFGLALWKYVESCLRMEHVYAQLVCQSFGGYGQLARVLDFGCGYGRLTRTLVHRLPRDRIWVADADADAVRWQARTFGVNGPALVSDSARFSVPLDFSVVFAGSVFSHLPEQAFRAWLSRLYRCVAPGGVLVLSVHDRTLLPPGGVDGFVYLSPGDGARTGGASYVSEDWLRRRVGQVLGERVDVRRFPRALYENQDLYVIGDRATLPRQLCLVAPPLAGFRSVTADSERNLLCDGWAMDFAIGPFPAQVSAQTGSGTRLDGELVGAEPDISSRFPGSPTAPLRWRLKVPAESASRGGTLHLRFSGSTGVVANAFLCLDGAVDAAASFTVRAT